MRKTLFSTFLMALCLTPTAWPQSEFPKNGQTYQTFQADVNGDGKPDKVGLVAYRVSSEEYWGQLTVWDSSGKVLWKAPQAKNADEALAFGAWNYGVSSIELVGDIDGDGKVELLAPQPQSDVRPPTFRIFRWTGSAFAPVARKQLLETPRGSGHFVWSQPSQWNGSAATWVGHLEHQGGAMVAQIYVVNSGSDVKLGKARMTADKQGLRVSSWVEKPK